VTELAKQGSQYSAETKRQACFDMIVIGNVTRVSEQLGIKRETLRDWTKTEWWNDLTAEIHRENGQELDARLSRMIDKTFSRVEQGLDQLDGKELSTGDIRGLAVTGAVLFDKQRIHRNQPTAIRSDSGGVAALAQQFAQLSEQWTEKQANVVQVIEQDGKNKDCD
jgi:hypothetical protein